MNVILTTARTLESQLEELEQQGYTLTPEEVREVEKVYAWMKSQVGRPNIGRVNDEVQEGLRILAENSQVDSISFSDARIH